MTTAYRTRPAEREDLHGWIAATRMIYHHCGRSVRSWGAKAFCDQCGLVWSMDTLHRFSDQDIADRFSVREIEQEGTAERLVWITTGGNEHAGTIVGAAPSDVRGVLNDGRPWRAWDV